MTKIRNPMRILFLFLKLALPEDQKEDLEGDGAHYTKAPKFVRETDGRVDERTETDPKKTVKPVVD